VFGCVWVCLGVCGCVRVCMLYKYVLGVYVCMRISCVFGCVLLGVELLTHDAFAFGESLFGFG
jgi:hypothetical protein